VLYDIDTDAAGNGTLVTDPLHGWLSEVQVNYGATMSTNGTLTITGEFNGVNETLLTVKGATDNTFPVTRPLVDNTNTATGDVGYWNLTGQKLTCLVNGVQGTLTPALQIKIGGSE